MNRWLPCLLLFSLFSGCISDPSVVNFSEAHYFDALYLLSSGGSIRATLSSPVQVADQDLGIRSALRLELMVDAAGMKGLMGENDTDAPLRILYYLDGDLLVVRTDVFQYASDRCVAEPESSCRHISWKVQGAPPPLGLLWPLLGSQRLVIASSDVEWNLTWENKENGLSRATSNLAIPPIRFLDSMGAAEYSRERQVPNEINMTATLWTRALSIQANLMSYEDRGPVQVVPQWPRPRYEPAPPYSPGMMFPGSAEPVLNSTFSYDDVVANLRRLSSEADSILSDGGCITSFGASPHSPGLQDQPTRETWPLFEMYVQPYYSKFNIVATPQEGVSIEYHLARYGPTLVQPERYEIESQQPSAFRFSCDLKEETRFGMPLEDILTKASRLPLDAASHLDYYQISWVPPDFKVWGTNGPVGMSVTFSPDLKSGPGADPISGKIYFSYQASIALGSGWFREMLLEEGDAQHLDAGEMRSSPLMPP